MAQNMRHVSIARMDRIAHVWESITEATQIIHRIRTNDRRIQDLDKALDLLGETKSNLFDWVVDGIKSLEDKKDKEEKV